VTTSVPVLETPLQKAVPETLSANPYPGLLYFNHENSHLFFGREGQCDALIGKMASSRFVAVVGTSGSGKSSLVRAGLLPSLWGGYLRQAGSDWLVTDFRPGSQPIKRLATALAGLEPFTDKVGVEAKLRESSLALAELVRDTPLNGSNLLVLVDQFEELFRFEGLQTSCNAHDERAAFVKLLLEAARAEGLPLYVVITMRSDFLGDCAAFRDLPEAISNSQFLIPRLSRVQQRAAIEGPANVAGGQMASRLVQQLLNDTALGQDDDQLPLLQHALMRTWDEWAKVPVGPIDLKHYEAIGTLSSALSKHADEAAKEATGGSPERERLLKIVFQRLGGRDERGRETRRDCTIQELIDVTGSSLTEILAVIEPFQQRARAFLMPLSDKQLAPADRLDVTHECFLRKWEVLRDQWSPEELDSARIYRKLVDRAEDQTPLGGRALTQTLDWWKRRLPNAAWAKRYGGDFEKVKHFKRRSQRTRRFKFLGFGAAAVVALGYGAFVTIKWFRAQQKSAIEQALREDAESQRGDAVSLMLARTAGGLANDPNLAETAALLGSATYFGRPHCAGTNEARAAITRALQLLPASTGHVPLPGGAKVALATKAKVLAAADGNGTVKLWQLPSLSLLGEVRAGTDTPKQLELSSDGTRLGIATQDKVRVFRLAFTPQFSSEPELILPCADEKWMSLSRDGADLIATCGNNVASWLRRESNTWRPPTGKPHGGMGWVVDHDGDRAAYVRASDDGFQYVVVDRNQKSLGRRSLPTTLSEWDVARSDVQLVLSRSAGKTLDFMSASDPPGREVHLTASDDVGTFVLDDHGQAAAATTKNGLIQLWTLPDGTERLHVRYEKPAVDLALDAEQGYLAVAFEDEVKLLELSLAQRFAVRSMTTSAGGVAVRTGSGERTLAVRGGDDQTTVSLLFEGKCQPSWPALSADGSKAAYVNCSGALRVSPTNAGITTSLTNRMRLPDDLPRRLMFSDDGRTLATTTMTQVTVTSARNPNGPSSSGTALHLFNVDDQSLKESSKEALPDGQNLWALSRAGTTVLVVSGEDKPSVRRFDVASQKWEPLKIELSKRPFALALSPKADWFAVAEHTSGKGPPSVTLWHTASLAAVPLRLTEHGDAVDSTTGLAFSPSGDQVVTADGSTVRVWDLQGRELARFLLPAPVTQVSFSIEGAQVLAMSGGHIEAIPWQVEAIRRAVCRSVGRELTAQEWVKYAPGEPHPAPVCGKP
jgi:hypothetical protein